MSDSNNLQNDCQQTGVIYLLKNTVNQKCYVGQTIQKLSIRLQQHQNGKIQVVDKAIQKYGWENFTYDVLEVCPVGMLNQREIFWIAEIDCMLPKGYNCTSGGNAPIAVSKETCIKISESKLKEKNPCYGKPRSKEICEKISKSTTGEKNHFYGKHHTAESKAKMSVAKIGRHLSDEHKAKISENGVGMRGKHHRDESKFKISCNFKKIFYPVLEMELEKKAITHKKLSEMLGLNYNTLAHKINGTRKLDLNTAEKIKKFLGVEMTLEELFCTENL